MNWSDGSTANPRTDVNVTANISVTANFNAAPVASNVNITGTPEVGQTLTGGYTYSDADGDAQGISTFRWLRNDVAIIGATALTYTIAPIDQGMTLKFEVTPVAQTGISPGVAVQSVAFGPVAIIPPAITNVLVDNTSIDNDAFVKNTDNLTVTATVRDALGLTAADITADLGYFYNNIGHESDHPVSYDATTQVATWNVSNAICSPSNGTITVTVSARNSAGGTSSASDAIEADNLAPTKVMGFAVSPAHKKVMMNWVNATGNDMHYRGVLVRYKRWNDYPKYDAAAPTYPATKTDGDGNAADITTGNSATQVFATYDRDIYYYTAFAYDSAGNYSVADTESQDRATNYWLSDIGSGAGRQIPGAGGYDGRANFDDLWWFSNLYGTSESAGWPYPAAAEADYGPTVASKSYRAGNRFAIPAPDNRVNFEDLMIFAMNYNRVAPKVAPPSDRHLATEFALELRLRNQVVASGEDLLVTVYLANDGRKVKGASVALHFDPAFLSVVDVTRGSLTAENDRWMFFHKQESNTIQIDAGVLGIDQTVDYSGELAVVRFHVVREGNRNVSIETASLRSGENLDHPFVIRKNVVEVPATFALEQNYPNPFNPSTTIKYGIPMAAEVELSVYSILGQKVVTLVNATQEAGYYRVEWNGANATASGVYFCLLRAGDFKSVRKMMLVK